MGFPVFGLSDKVYFFGHKNKTATGLKRNANICATYTTYSKNIIYYYCKSDKEKKEKRLSEKVYLFGQPL